MKQNPEMFDLFVLRLVRFHKLKIVLVLPINYS